MSFHLDQTMIWGFGATIVLTTIMSGSRWLNLTRMDLPFLLGTIFTANRDRARWYGFAYHLINGWLFALIYVAAMETSGLKTVWFGLLIGFLHGLFVLVVLVRMLPGIHPRMASEFQGPDPTRQLEPPGYLALNYGKGTPISTMVAHLVYGGMIGLLYH